MRKCDRTCACGNFGAKEVRSLLEIVRAKCVRGGYLQGAGEMQFHLIFLIVSYEIVPSLSETKKNPKREKRKKIVVFYIL